MSFHGAFFDHHGALKSPPALAPGPEPNMPWRRRLDERHKSWYSSSSFQADGCFELFGWVYSHTKHNLTWSTTGLWVCRVLKAFFLFQASRFWGGTSTSRKPQEENSTRAGWGWDRKSKTAVWATILIQCIREIAFDRMQSLHWSHDNIQFFASHLCKWKRKTFHNIFQGTQTRHFHIHGDTSFVTLPPFVWTPRFPEKPRGKSILHVFCIDTAVVTLPEVKNEALSRTKKIPAMGKETHRHQDLLRCCWLVFGQTPKNTLFLFWNVWNSPRWGVLDKSGKKEMCML